MAAVKLNGDVIMPLLGLPPQENEVLSVNESKQTELLSSWFADAWAITVGTYRIRGYDNILSVTEAALAAGYRCFDTAAVYHNEEDIGKCLQVLLPKYGLSREDIFIISKLAPKDQGSGVCKKACLQSIAQLQCSYLDLYLIHWPGTQRLKPEDPQQQLNRLGSWSDMEQLCQEGKIRAIGVSNFLQAHLESLLSVCKIRPAVLQSEYHPHLVQSNLVQYCRQHGIHFQAYSSLGTSSEKNELLTDSTLLAVAKKLNKTPAQVLLRWAVQQNIGVLPKSTNPDHIRENADIFSFCLSDNDMTALSSLHSSTHYCWDPSKIV